METSRVIKSDFDKICRLCLCQDNSLVCLFTREQDVIPLALVAQTCAAVDIDEEDGLPPNICCVCRDTILSSYQFRQQVSRNDTILRCIAGMKQDPDDEGLKKEMMGEPSWTVISAEDGSSKQAIPYDAEVSLNYMFTTNSRIELEAEEIPSGCSNPKEVTEVEDTQLLGHPSVMICTGDRSLYDTDGSLNYQLTANTETDVRHAGVKEESLPEDTENDPLTVGKESSVGKCYLKKGGNSEMTRISSCSNDNRKSFSTADKQRGSKTRLENKTFSRDSNKTSFLKLEEYGTPTPHGCFFCKHCKIIYGSRGKFYSHVKFKHLKIGGIFCDLCCYRVQYKYELRQHFKDVHLGISKNIGSLITANNQEPNIKIKRTRKHKGSAIVDEVHAKMLEFGTLNPDGSYYCQPCKKFYMKAYYSHVKVFHLKIRDFMCEQCGFRAISKVNLSAHIDGIHLRVKKYKCPHCPLRFCTEANLKIHSRRNHRPKAVKTSMCEMCGKSFTTPESLMRHSRAQHFPELKIKCNFCDCRYAAPNKLRAHVKKMH